jgi:hypothetical protein
MHPTKYENVSDKSGEILTRRMLDLVSIGLFLVRAMVTVTRETHH